MNGRKHRALAADQKRRAALRKAVARATSTQDRVSPLAQRADAKTPSPPKGAQPVLSDGELDEVVRVAARPADRGVTAFARFARSGESLVVDQEQAQELLETFKGGDANDAAGATREPVHVAQPATDRTSDAGAALVPSRTAELAASAEVATQYAQESRSKATRDAYAWQWAAWSEWAREHGLEPLPADPRAVALWITQRIERGDAVSTIGQGLSALKWFHKQANLPAPQSDPALQAVWDGIRRVHGVAPKRQAMALRPAQLRLIVATGASVKGVRDRAMLLVGFAGGFRRGELVALNLADLAEKPEGFVITVRRSKKDQLGEGRVKAINFTGSELCPATALLAWLALLGEHGVTEGALFRSVHKRKAGDEITDKRLWPIDVLRVLQAASKRAGVPITNMTAHSLRAGFVTTGVEAGVSLEEIVQQTGQTLATAQRYVRGYELLKRNLAKKVGL